MEKINVQLMRDGSRSVYDYTEDSLKILANKINEIIDVLDKKEHMTTPQQMIEEAVDQFIDSRQQKEYRNEFIQDLLKICNQSHIQLLEEMRESNPKYRISWDTADGGSEWCVQIWKINKDGTAELYQSLSNKSDDGGSFDLDTLTFIDKKLAEYKELI